MRSERGQVLPFVLIGLLIMLLGVAGLVVDAGQGYWAKRQLQAATDAAALAAAQELPDTTVARALAAQYGVNGLNTIRGATVDTPQVTPKCLSRTPSCDPTTTANAVVVQSTA